MRTETCSCGAKTTINIDKPGESLLHSSVTDQEAEQKAIQDWRENHKHDTGDKK